MKKIFKRWAPTRERLKSTWLYNWFGNHILHPSLWAFNRRSITWAVAIGVACAFVPIPSQMLLAALIAIWLQVNVPVAILGVWISNPLTTVPIYYFSYRVGVWIMVWLGSPPESVMDLDKLGSLFKCLATPFSCKVGVGFMDMLWPMLLGLLVCGLISTVLSFVLVNEIWKYQTRQNWSRRQLRRKLEAVKTKIKSVAHRSAPDDDNDNHDHAEVERLDKED